ncbi:hypothetical protein I4U23_003512 [Adineta vaga]|nr:hypothetical protein I4U23_003512 [Adineta vaga]
MESKTISNADETSPKTLTSIFSERILAGINSAHYQQIFSFAHNEYYKGISSSNETTRCDFTFGNPREMALPAFLSSYQKYIEPLNPQWYAYCDENNSNSHPSRKIIASNLSKQFSPLSFDCEDIHLVTGNIGGLYTCLSMLLNKDDQVIFSTPTWFLYEAMILRCSATPIIVKSDQKTFDLDLDTIKAHINDKTKIIIINSPHNPTGRIYSLSLLQSLANLLLQEYERRKIHYGDDAQPIWLISDEAYKKIIFKNSQFICPASVYPYTFICYTYGKTLLNPGIRLGYIALSDQIPFYYRSLFRLYIPQTRMMNGFMVPDCISQYSIQDIETLSIGIDMDRLEKKLNIMCDMLISIGYEIPIRPEGTFYVMVKSPLEDDRAFCVILSEYNIWCLPGSVCVMKGYFRICLTATEEMIEKSEDGFREAFKRA